METSIRPIINLVMNRIQPFSHMRNFTRWFHFTFVFHREFSLPDLYNVVGEKIGSQEEETEKKKHITNPPITIWHYFECSFR